MTLPALTDEQQAFVDHAGEAFVEACPGAGKTRAIVSRIHRLSLTLPPRKGIAVLSFTNTAVDEFKERCFSIGLESSLRHPGFIGTFDAFIRHFFVMPAGIPGVHARPHIVDSWKTLGIDDIRLSGEAAFYAGVSLDKFSAVDGTIDFTKINNDALQRHVQQYQDRFENAALARRNALRRNGTLSSADARVVAIENLGREGWEQAWQDALSARFSEIIVDEAQDSNDVDLALLELLKAGGIPVTVVCDPDQAIYQFRHGMPSELGEFRQTYSAANQLSLTGNFRSSPSICRLAATLRAREEPDDTLGASRDIQTPIQILEYGASIQPAIGQSFSALALERGISIDQTYILSHGRSAAIRAAGKGGSTSNSGAKTAQMAVAVGAYWSSAGSNKTREYALRTVEKLILQLTGMVEDNQPLSKAIERNNLSERELRRTALTLLTSLPKACAHTDDGRATWLEALRASTVGLNLELPQGQTIRSFFSSRGNTDWSKALQENDQQSSLPCATVHEAKGREYDAVCFVIQPNRAPQNYTEQLFHAWEEREGDEAKRVAYVAITRAKNLAGIAVPSAYSRRLTSILDAAGVQWERHDLTQ
ncbi:ATP-dependent helicase [Magnetovibrio sp. PR-2]|uniref:ATP-dependent helicase n=1 Tax=Magnetovibrio sp. PR-2 TaxID=3120356 RepID=UPI002FCE4FC2